MVLSFRNELFFVFFTLFLCLGSALFAAQPAKADTFCSGGEHFWGVGQDNFWDDCLYYYTVNLDKDTYAPGETIQADGSAQTSMCDNEDDSTYVYLDGQADYSDEWYRLIDGTPTPTEEDAFTSSYPTAYQDGTQVGDLAFGTPIYGSASYTAPSDPGTSGITFTGTGQYTDDDGNAQYGSGSIDEQFTVEDDTPPPPPNQLPKGNVEALSCTTFRGWAFDPDESSNPAQIGLRIYDQDGNHQDTEVYDPTIVRNDVNTAYGIDGTHGFSFNAPATLNDGGKHSVTVVAYDTWGGDPAILTTKSLDCSASVPAATASVTSCTLNGGSCPQYLTYSASNTNQNEVDIQIKAPNGTITKQTGQPASGTLSFQANQTGTYTFSVYDFNKSFAAGSLLKTVTAPTYPSPTLTCNNGASCSVDAGKSVSLKWSCASTPSDTSSSANFSTGGALSGTTSVTPSQTTTYTVQCLPSKSTSNTTVTVLNPEIQYFNVDPAMVRINGSSTLTWSASNVDSCMLKGPGVSLSGTSGSKTVSSLSGQSIYTLTCQTGLGPISISRTINLVPLLQEK